MIQLSTAQTISIFPILMGCLAIVLALLARPLLRLVGLKPRSEVFTNPRFQRAAKITENLVRLFLLVVGAGFLVRGVGPLFLPDAVTQLVEIASVGLSVLIVLVVIGANLLAIRKG